VSRRSRGRLQGRGRVLEVQRARLLAAALDVIGEHGWEGMTVERVTRRAGVSSKTFYEVFAEREDCFLGVFDSAIERLAALAAHGYRQDGGNEQDRGWAQGLRGAVLALLEFLEYEPAIRRLVFVDAPAVGPKVQARREGVRRELEAIIDRGRRESPPGSRPPRSAAQGALEGALAVLEGWLLQPRLLRQTYLLEPRPVPMTELLGPLMSRILAPYLGPEAAQQELELPTRPAGRPRHTRTPTAPVLSSGTPVAFNGRPVADPVADPLAGLQARLTYRTLRVLEAIAELNTQNPTRGAPNNRQVADAAAISNPSQASRLLARLQNLGLVQNTSERHGNGRTNAWTLTPQGKEIQQALPQKDSA
jgi:AcrR family transcriptional regulator/DNA-binding MarR family transcriptional regulator